MTDRADALFWPRAEVMERWLRVEALLSEPDGVSSPLSEGDRKLLEEEGLLPWYFLRSSSRGGRSEGDDRADPEARAAFSRSYARHLQLEGLLSQVSDVLGRESIPVLAIKGGLLSRTVYPHSASRPVADLDIVVPSSQGPKVDSILKDLRFEATPPSPFGRHSAFMGHAQAYRSSDFPDAILDLHYRLLDEPLLKEEKSETWFWDHTLPLKLGEAEVRALKPEIHLLYLCAHLICDHGSFPRMVWLLDLLLLCEAQADPAFFGEVVAAGEKIGWLPYLRVVAPAAFKFDKTFGLSLPETGILMNGGEYGGGCRIRTIMESQSNKSLRGLHRLSRLTPGGRLLYLWCLLLPSPAYMKVRYSCSHILILPLLYPFRWCAILIRGAAGLLKALFMRRHHE